MCIDTSDSAKIISLEELCQIRDSLGRIVCASGGFDPIHPGHIDYIIKSKRFGDKLVVLVCGDPFLINKKGRAFMDLNTRCKIVAGIRNVDYVVPFEIENDQTVCVALQRLRPHVFTKGGDRTDHTNIPEWRICQDLGIDLITGVGGTKDWSSSDFLKRWGEFWMQTHTKDTDPNNNHLEETK